MIELCERLDEFLAMLFVMFGGTLDEPLSEDLVIRLKLVLRESTNCTDKLSMNKLKISLNGVQQFGSSPLPTSCCHSLFTRRRSSAFVIVPLIESQSNENLFSLALIEDRDFPVTVFSDELYCKIKISSNILRFV